MHVVLISRSDPPLSLSRYRARNQLGRNPLQPLRFTQEEIALFLNEMMGLKLTASDIQALEARTEGWIAGLQLAAISMQSSPDVHAFVSAFTGSHYYIMDYLTEEVASVSARESALIFTANLHSRPPVRAVMRGRLQGRSNHAHRWRRAPGCFGADESVCHPPG